MRYWDTSALLKLYVTEPDSARFRAHASATGPVLTSDVARWELFVVLQRKEAAGDITQGTAQAFYSQFEMDIAAARVVVRAADAKQLPGFQSLVKKLYQQQPPHLIRTLDALHLAAAQAGQATEFVTTDQRQAQAAAALGLPLFT
ncbi:MAG: type II toxin-antitoxin system VapC family toxin [Verrucomicrobia bacterium]|nr:type II toxin-antitoxin system VapC family toxin [Verrucomicrobiota bacterium]